MDIGQTSVANGGAVVESRQQFKPFARPRLKRRRVTPTKPSLFAVRPNPPHYALDFSEHCKTVERLAASLIQSDVRAVSVVGLPGSGKTVILRGVAYHPFVYSLFPDGICFVQLSGYTTVDMLFAHFGEIVSRMGGGVYSEFVKACARDGKHAAAMDSVLRYLKEKRFLLILDNVSASIPNVTELLLQLSPSKAPRGPGKFTILTSTRSVETARKIGGNSILNIHLHDPCGERARNILCAHAGFDRMYFDAACRKKDSAAFPVLRKCSGLPLALAIAGGAIKRLLKDAKTPEARDYIWVQYKAYLFDNFDQFGEISGLFTALTACRLSIEAGTEWDISISVSDVLCSFCVAKHSVWIPIEVLQRLWGIKSEDKVTSAIRALSQVCLVTQELRRGSAGILIPDIVIDFCEHIAKKASSVYRWHVKFLSSYSGLQIDKASGNLKQQAGNSEPVVSNTTFDEDQYLQETLSHHLAKALAASSGKKAEKSTLTAAVNMIQNRIAKKYEMRKQKRGPRKR